MIDKYNYTVAWSEEDDAYIGRVAEFPLLAAHGETLEEALKEIESVVGSVLEDLEESQEPIPAPFSIGRQSVRFTIPITSELHQNLAFEANREGVPLHQLVERKLASTS